MIRYVPVWLDLYWRYCLCSCPDPAVSREWKIIVMRPDTFSDKACRVQCKAHLISQKKVPWPQDLHNVGVSRQFDSQY